MTLRITRDDDRAPAVTLRLEGRLVGASAALLARECSILRGAVAVDLAGVVVVDRFAVEVLKRLHRSGVAIRGCSDLIASILEVEGVRVERDDGATGEAAN